MEIDEDELLEIWEKVDRRSGTDRRKGERRKAKMDFDWADRRQRDRRTWLRRKTDRGE